MTPNFKKMTAVFYCSKTGREPVREWLKSLNPLEKRTIGHDIATVEYGWPIGMPVCRSLGNGIWEIRSSLPTRKIARVLFSFLDGNIVLLDGFIKKTQKTPLTEIKIAQKRLSEIKYENK